MVTRKSKTETAGIVSRENGFIAHARIAANDRTKQE
jgi:hypothetical protein